MRCYYVNNESPNDIFGVNAFQINHHTSSNLGEALLFGLPSSALPCSLGEVSRPYLTCSVQHTSNVLSFQLTTKRTFGVSD